MAATGARQRLVAPLVFGLTVVACKAAQDSAARRVTMAEISSESRKEKRSLVEPQRTASVGMPFEEMVLAADFTRDSRLRTPSCDAEDAVLRIWREDRDGYAFPVCLGTVVGKVDGAALAVTSAHCLQREGRSERSGQGLFVEVLQGSGQNRHAVSHWAAHPRFVSTPPTPVYDLALFTVPAFSTQCALSMNAEVENEIAKGTPLVLFRDGDSVEATHAAVSAVQALSLDFASSSIPVCYGDSGSPLLVERHGISTLVGVVSSGSSRCTGSFRGARIRAMRLGSVATPANEGPSLHVSEPGCAACIEELGSGSGPCLSALSRCHAARHWSEALSCLAECMNESCITGCSEVDNDSRRRLQAVTRCAHHNGCSRACKCIQLVSTG